MNGLPAAPTATRVGQLLEVERERRRGHLELAAMSPTQRPSDPFATRQPENGEARILRSRELATAVFDSIFLVSSNYKRSVKLPLSAGHGVLRSPPSNGGMTMKRIATLCSRS